MEVDAREARHVAVTDTQSSAGAEWDCYKETLDTGATPRIHRETEAPGHCSESSRSGGIRAEF